MIKNYLFLTFILVMGLLASSTIDAKDVKVKILYKGNAEHRGLYGLKFNKFTPDDNILYAVELVGNRALKMRVNNGDAKILDSWDDSLVTPDGVRISTPDGIAVGPDGSIYTADVIAGSVLRIKPDSTLQHLTFSWNFGGANGLEFSDDGSRMFMSQCISGGSLYEVKDLNPSASPFTTDGNLRLITDQLGLGTPCSINSFEYRDGSLYGARFFIGDVVKVDPDTGDYEVIISASNLNTPNNAPLILPVAVKIDPQGRLYVLENLGERLIRFVKDGNGIWSLDKIVVDGGLPYADNMAIDSKGNLYISGATSGFLYKVSESGDIKALYDVNLTTPTGLAVVGDSLFIGDTQAVVEINKQSGDFLAITTNNYLGGGLLFGLNIRRCDGDKIVNPSWFTSTVQIWDPAANSFDTYATPGYFPTDAYCDSNNNILISDIVGRISKIDRNDRSITDLPVFLNQPINILESPTGDIISTEFGTGTIYNISTGDVIVSGLDEPEGAVFDTDGRLLVVEVGKRRLISVDITSGNIEAVAANLNLGGTKSYYGHIAFFGWYAGLVAGVDIDPQTGTIYVSGDDPNVIYEITRK